MGGLFGILDPSGADQPLLARAAESASYRGSQRIVASGPFAAGVYVPDGRLRSFGARGECARGRRARRRWSSGSPAAKLERSFSGVELLDEVLRASGPPGLMGLAADFALARFDLQRGVLTLARDAFGLRPLYWAKVGRRFAFASDASVLQHLGLASADLDPAVVAGYLCALRRPTWEDRVQGCLLCATRLVAERGSERPHLGRTVVRPRAVGGSTLKDR